MKDYNHPHRLRRIRIDKSRNNIILIFISRNTTNNDKEAGIYNTVTDTEACIYNTVDDEDACI